MNKKSFNSHFFLERVKKRGFKRNLEDLMGTIGFFTLISIVTPIFITYGLIKIPQYRKIQIALMTILDPLAYKRIPDLKREVRYRTQKKYHVEDIVSMMNALVRLGYVEKIEDKIKSKEEINEIHDKLLDEYHRLALPRILDTYYNTAYRLSPSRPRRIKDFKSEVNLRSILKPKFG